MDDTTVDLFITATALCATALALMQKRKKKKARRYWVRPWVGKKHKNVFNNLVQEMRLEDEQAFYNYHRMSRKNFAELLDLVAPLIKKQDTKMRKAVSPAQRLCITLRYLATGETRRSLEFQHRTSHSLISRIIPETCDAIYTCLKNDYLKLPTSSEEWQQVAAVFSNVWNFPMCIGALDGKRFLIRKPANTGSEYYDYKAHHSIIMLALITSSCMLMLELKVEQVMQEYGTSLTLINTWKKKGFKCQEMQFCLIQTQNLLM